MYLLSSCMTSRTCKQRIHLENLRAALQTNLASRLNFSSALVEGHDRCHVVRVTCHDTLTALRGTLTPFLFLSDIQ